MSRPVNLVPNIATRKLAARMLKEAHHFGGPEVAHRNLSDVAPDQLYALVGLLLSEIRPIPKDRPGPRPIPLTMTEEARRKAHSLYQQGDRSEFAVLGHREYQRANRRISRARREAAAEQVAS